MIISALIKMKTGVPGVPQKKAEPAQLGFSFTSWGGARKGAGRKGRRTRPVPHGRRNKLNPRHPVHVTLHARRDVPHLRSQVCFAALRRAFRGGRDRFGMRLVHFSVQGNHVHLLVEADEGARSLSRGMAGLGIRMARQLNRAVGRRGALFRERYHAQVIGNPRQVRHALRYVLLNSGIHAARGREHSVAKPRGPATVDPCSSAACFDGWRNTPRVVEPWGPATELVAPARTWLLSTGWKIWGLIAPSP